MRAKAVHIIHIGIDVCVCGVEKKEGGGAHSFVHRRGFFFIPPHQHLFLLFPIFLFCRWCGWVVVGCRKAEHFQHATHAALQQQQQALGCSPMCDSLFKGGGLLKIYTNDLDYFSR